jgi:CubicO group peptidase (beta-lactamase class C family)
MGDVIMKKPKAISHIIFITTIILVLTSCLMSDPLKLPFQSFTPQNFGDGWEIADPASVGIDGEALKNVYRYVHEEDNVWQIRSLLVFRNNRLIAESYMKDRSDRTNLHPIWSCTKQVVSILTGIAVDKGMISINDTILDHLPQVSSYPEKSGITIENLLMMKSGINYNNDGYFGHDAMFARGEPSNSLDFILGLGMHSSPGEQFRYKNSDPHIISAILQERSGKTTRDWAQEVLFSKIGITRLEWRTYKDGITFGCFGILTTPREMGKIGQLAANNGMWNGEQVVSANWINEMTSVKVHNINNLAFGYFWWKDVIRNINISWGHGGQFILINRDENLVVVITSERHTAGAHHLSLDSALSIYDRIYNSIL